jgi:hypothetical protein
MKKLLLARGHDSAGPRCDIAASLGKRERDALLMLDISGYLPLSFDACRVIQVQGYTQLAEHVHNHYLGAELHIIPLGRAVAAAIGESSK